MDSNTTAVHGDSSSSFVALRQNLYVQAIVTALVICVCTRLLSSHWFNAVKYGRGHSIQPPTLPYWIPGLKHGLSMGIDSKKFLASCLNKYGDGSPFFIDAAGQKLLILLDPEHIKGVLRSSTELDPNPFIHERILGALMGSPQAAIDHYKSEKGNTDYIQTTHIRQHTTGSNLTSLDKRLFHVLKRTIEPTLSDSGWTDLPDLYAFVEYHVSFAIAETLLGSAIVESYPNIITDLWIHIESTDQFLMGLPRFIIPKAYAARDRLLSHIRKWSTKSESLRHENAVDTKWDPTAGSALVQEREELYGEMPGHDEHGRASQVLGLLYAGTSLTVPMTFWYFFETMRDTSLHDRILAELKSQANVEEASYNFMQLSARPVFQSMHAETTRMYSSNLTAREVVVPEYALDAKYTVEQGTTVLISSKFAGQFEPAWAKARPHTVTRPLNTFWAERYITCGEDKRERFSDAGLGGSWMSFGGGEHKCPGRHFARNIGIVTLAVLMGEFECELVDPKAAHKMDPNLKEKAFGTTKPTGRIAARIRRREK
ncbi:cytochrome P450 [Clathrospora elynae]|uniref:Cytochrome P450 n=1 Tax=Clathrospora elynae TaxID=706981 RepID=A0A6A5S945_9PLEO|nr:cytochrome P450 [Clathrospora elynae]